MRLEGFGEGLLYRLLYMLTLLQQLPMVAYRTLKRNRLLGGGRRLVVAAVAVAERDGELDRGDDLVDEFFEGFGDGCYF